MNVTLHINGKPVMLENMARKQQELSFTLGGKSYTFCSHRLPNSSFLLEHETASGVWQRMSGSVWRAGKDARVQVGNFAAKVTEHAADAAHAGQQAELSPPAPMPGLIRQIMVKAGERVAEGQALLVMEAMKLQITLSAGGDAKVDELLVSEGDLVTEGADLVRLTAEEPDGK